VYTRRFSENAPRKEIVEDDGVEVIEGKKGKEKLEFLDGAAVQQQRCVGMSPGKKRGKKKKKKTISDKVAVVGDTICRG